MSHDQAETGQLEILLARLGAGLDQYLEFKQADAQRPGHRWHLDLDVPLPERGEGIDAVSRTLLEQIIPNASAVPNPGFSAYITTGATTASLLAMTAANIASPQRYMRTAFNFLEELSLQWLAEMFGISPMQGVYSSGGSVANLVALGGARQSAFEQLGQDPAADGVDRPVKIYASEECHHTIQRAAGVLGMGRKAVRAIPCDPSGRIQLEALEAAIEHDIAVGILPLAVVANAGTTNTGAIDPLRAMGEIAREYGIWFHVDGAYGLPGILDSRICHLYDGLELADSVIVDPHKWLGASVGVAATFVRDREILQRAFMQEPADYLEGSVDQSDRASDVLAHSMEDFGIPYFDYGVELSAPCRGVAVWAMLKEIGVQGMRERVCRHNDMAHQIAKLADAHPNLEVLAHPTLSICCFRYVDQQVGNLDEFNRQLHRRLVRENEYMPSTTRVNGQLAIRPCYIGARHQAPQDTGLVEAVLRNGRALLELS